MYKTSFASNVRLAPIAGSAAEKPTPSGVAPRSGMTSLELVIVFSIGIASSLVVVPLAAQLGDDAQAAATRATLRTLRNVVEDRYGVDLRSPMGEPPLPYGADGRAANLKYLFVPPATTTQDGTRWNGPYLHRSAYYPAPTEPGPSGKTAAERGFTSHYAAAGDPTVLDAWGNPVVLLASANGSAARLVSAGPNGVLETSPDAAGADRSDDLILTLSPVRQAIQTASAE